MLSKTTLLSLALAAFVIAQQQSTTTQTLLLPGYDKQKGEKTSITAIGSNSDTTTYSLSCVDPVPTSAFGSAITDVRSILSSAGVDINSIFSSAGADINSLISQGSELLASITARDAAPTAAPRPAPFIPRGLLQRQNTGPDDADDEILLPGFCLPYTFIQGPSTYSAHISIEAASISVAFNCNFGTGRIFEADATCTTSGVGNLFDPTATDAHVETTRVSEYTKLAQTVAVTLGSAPQSGSGTTSAAGARNTLNAGGRVDTNVFGLAGAAGAAFLGAALAL